MELSHSGTCKISKKFTPDTLSQEAKADSPRSRTLLTGFPGSAVQSFTHSARCTARPTKLKHRSLEQREVYFRAMRGEEVSRALRGPELSVSAAQGRHCRRLISCARSSDSWMGRQHRGVTGVNTSALGSRRRWLCAHDHHIIMFAWCSCSGHLEVKIIFELQAIKKANIAKLSTAHLLRGRAGQFLRAQQGFVSQRPLNGVQGKPDSCVPHLPSWVPCSRRSKSPSSVLSLVSGPLSRSVEAQCYHAAVLECRVCVCVCMCVCVLTCA